jgi:DNA-binding transcriptional regulator LsrR (DeoR family)
MVQDTLINNRETKQILEKARKVDIAFVGIGSPIESSNLLKTRYLKNNETKNFKKHGTVGDICSRFFDKNGNISES